MLKKWLREPLIHFLIIGGLLFALYGFQNDGISDQNTRIVFNKADINRLVLLWEKKRQRPPTQQELKGLIEQQIHEEVLYREGIAMGLDRNDSIVRRRIAQKVEYISADLAAQVEPTESELEEYLKANSEKFAIPGRISFVQIYLSPEKRGIKVEKDAGELLLKLNKLNSNADVNEYGDPIMLGQQHTQLTEFGVSRLFGKEFTQNIFKLDTGRWNGPVFSSFGLHLVRIDKKTMSLTPELAAVRDKVRIEWLNQQRLKMNKAFYQSLRQRYDIIIDDTSMSVSK